MTGRLDQAATANKLQEELRDLLCIAVVGDHVRWVLTGDDIAEFAQWLSGATGQWRAWADQVATRLVALGVAPDGRVRSLAKDVPFNWVPDGWLELDGARQLVSDRVSKVADWARVGSVPAREAAPSTLATMFSRTLGRLPTRLSRP